METTSLSKKSNILIQTFEDVATLVGERTEINGQKVGLNLTKEKTTCKESAQQLKNGIFKVLVMGRYNAGKSSFINALMQSKFLPENMRPCTSILTFVQYGESPLCELHYKRTQTNGTLDEEKVITMDVTEFFTTYQYTSDDDKEFESTGMVKRFSEISYAVVKTNNPLLLGGVQIIDSPGLNNNEIDNTLSLNAAENANAILYLGSADEQFDMHDRSYFDKHFTNSPVNVFFIVNKYDLCATEQDRRVVKQKVENDIKKYFYDTDDHFHEDLMKSRIFYVSARYAQYGLGMITTKQDDFGNDHIISESEKSQYYAMSGFDKLEQGLSEFLQTDTRLQAEWNSNFTRLSEVYGKINQKIDEDSAIYESNMLSSESARNEYKDKINNLQLQISTLESKVDTESVKTQQLLSNVLTTAIEDIDKSWEDDIVDIANEVNFSFGKYLKLVLKNINVFKAKDERTEEINQMLTPFAESVARHFMLRIEYNTNKQKSLIEHNLETSFNNIYQDVNDMKSKYEELVEFIMPNVPIENPSSPIFTGGNGNLVKNLISLYLGDFSEIAKGASEDTPLLDYIKRTVINTLWQATLAIVAGGIALPIIVAIEAWQMHRNKDKFVINMLEKTKSSVLQGLRDNIQQIIDSRNVLVAEFMENIKVDCCGEYKNSLFEKMNQLDELESNMADTTFNYQEELNVRKRIKGNVFTTISTAYEQVIGNTLSEEQLLAL